MSLAPSPIDDAAVVSPSCSVSRCRQEPKANMDGNFNSLVRGSLTVSVREAHGDMPDEPTAVDGYGDEVRFGWPGWRIKGARGRRPTNARLGVAPGRPVPTRDFLRCSCFTRSVRGSRQKPRSSGGTC